MKSLERWDVSREEYPGMSEYLTELSQCYQELVSSIHIEGVAVDMHT